MQVFDNKSYINELIKHYEDYYDTAGKRLILTKGPIEKLHRDFCVLEFSPNSRHRMYSYCTVGMSVDRLDNNLIELVIYSLEPSNSMVELMTMCASFHRNREPLNVHHTVNIGQPWLNNSKCDHGFISLPYLDGQQLEIFKFGAREIHCYWFIPITEKERNYKVENGCEALEQLFENRQLDYSNPKRDSLV
jgi:hypothetical protein